MDKRVKILAVCGMGVGTSMILKLQIQKALNELNTNADIDIADIGTARGLAMSADLIVTTKDLAERLGDVKPPILIVNNFMDLTSITNGISEKLNIKRD